MGQIRILIVVLCISPFFSLAQTDERQDLADRMFIDDEPLDVTLVSDFKEFRKEKFNEEYQPAWISFKLGDGNILEDSIKIKARGNYRRKNCYTPPIRLNFKKSAFTPKDTSSFLDKIKLVSVCRSSPIYQDYVLKEYLVYKMYELITDYSFRTRLFRIKYIDTYKGKMKETDTYAFIIEDIDNVGHRTNSMEIEVKGLQEKSVDSEMAVDMAVFQFMVGNTDWSIPGVHNIKFLKVMDPSVYTPVVIPYDFDYTGFVNASYAVPAEILGIESVTDRLYRGVCRSREEYEKSFQKMIDLRPQFTEMIENAEGLSKGARFELENYLNKFYTIINSKSMVDSYFINGCRKL